MTKKESTMPRKVSIKEFDQLWAEPSDLMEVLALRWYDLWERLQLEHRTGQFETVMARWQESHRHYHTPRHLLECLNVLDFVKGYCMQPDLVEMALWYHDIFYNMHGHDNEERSAELARSTFVKSGGSEASGEEVRQIVLATTHRLPVRTLEAAIATDVDLAILGATPERYAVYEQNVRLEYAHVAEVHYRTGRSRLLLPFLMRKQIFRTPFLHQLLEHRAGTNLRGALNALADPV